MTCRRLALVLGLAGALACGPVRGPSVSDPAPLQADGGAADGGAPDALLPTDACRPCSQQPQAGMLCPPAACDCSGGRCCCQ